MDSEQIGIYLDLVAAKAKALASDVKNNRTWPGDISQGIREIQDSLNKASEGSKKWDSR
jgi:hypothetical protein